MKETIFKPLSRMLLGDLRKLKYRSLIHEDPYRHEFAAALGKLSCRSRNHDLDLGVLLSMTQKAGPSVIQVRTQDVTPEAIGSLVLIALEKHGEALDRGALLSIQRQTSRVRVLPIEKADPGDLR